ncbi:hypothetical protein TWF106_003930 [Orbilia oligospora]|uniref:Uncharacterized protein n=1 Tax=Orbilia oligospora TaxID=2813651 RepID=A0A7C8QTS5_ORBOL|nr:hypothetical protein TWF106_003930 [Orbilia oligospora]
MNSSNSKEGQTNINFQDIRRRLWLRKIGSGVAIEQLGFRTEEQKEDLRRILQKIAANDQAERAAAPVNRRRRKDENNDENENNKSGFRYISGSKSKVDLVF